MKHHRHKLAASALLAIVASATSRFGTGAGDFLQGRSRGGAGGFRKGISQSKHQGVRQEVEKGKTAYEISSLEGGTRRDVLFSGDGTLIVIEEAIAIAKRPGPSAAGSAQKVSRRRDHARRENHRVTARCCMSSGKAPGQARGNRLRSQRQ